MLNGGDGICIEDGNNNLIGGTVPSQGNKIHDNAGRGVSSAKLCHKTGLRLRPGIQSWGIRFTEMAGSGSTSPTGEGNFGVTMNRYLNAPPLQQVRPDLGRLYERRPALS